MVSSHSPDRPIFLVIGGPNGSGKSSVYANARIDLDARTVWIVNPDLLAARISSVEQMTLPEANLLAVERIEAWLETSLRTHSSVGVETVLSTDKYRRLVTLAQELGFEFRLIYVLLDTPELNVQRVRLRVAKGGHNVPEDRIHARFWRSLEQMRWYLRAADTALLYDNSAGQPELIAWKEDGDIVVRDEAPDVLKQALRGVI